MDNNINLNSNIRRELPQIPSDRAVFRESIILFFLFAPILLAILGLVFWYGYARLFGGMSLHLLLDIAVLTVGAFGVFITYIFSAMGFFYRVILSAEGVHVQALKTSSANNFIKWDEIEHISLTKRVFTKRFARLNPFTKSFKIVEISSEELYDITKIKQYRKKRIEITFERPNKFDVLDIKTSDGVDYDKIAMSVSKKMLLSLEKYASYELRQKVFTLLRYQKQSNLQ